MVTVESREEKYQAIASNGRVEVPIDAPIDKGGQGAGFGAHELLETAIAGCLNMAVRMHATKHGFPLQAVRTRVQIVRPDPSTVRFEQSMELEGTLSDAQRAALVEIANSCPVRQTLSKSLDFAVIE
ncbi:MAG TPA: OsmC family protein [Steroidobacteraceae bacterium]|jgi:putative redox protein|nr:OsmC family protein [Steroidobacteraceae bacterium]